MLMQISCGCCDVVDPVYVNWTRSQHLVQPLNSDGTVSGYSQPWVFGSPFTLQELSGHSSLHIWHLKGPGGLTATEGTPQNPRWVIKMRPVRYRIGDAGYANFFARQTRQFLNWFNRETAFSDASPNSAAHFGSIRLTSVIVQPPIATLYNSAQSECTHARMRVNGVDVSGVVELDSFANFAGSQIYACRPAVMPISPTVILDDDVIEFDYWFKLSVTQSEGWFNASNGINTNPIPIVGAATQSRLYTRPNLEFRTVLNGMNVAQKISVADRIKLTFGSNGPGGVTELVLEPQANWTYLQTGAAAIRMTKSSGTGTGEWVQFDWQREIPQVQIRRNVTMPGGSQPLTRYLPVDSSHYGQIDGQSTPGIWAENTPVVFSVKSVWAPSGAAATGFVDPSIAPASYFSSFPSSVTVERA